MNNSQQKRRRVFQVKSKLSAAEASAASQRTRQLLLRTPARIHGKVALRDQLAADLVALKRICERLSPLLGRIGAAIRHLERSDHRRARAVQALLKRLIVLEDGNANSKHNQP